MISSKIGFSRVRPVLGTYFKISLNHEACEKTQNILTAAFFEAERLENIFSKFILSSSLSQLNRAQSNILISVPRELYFLLRESKKLWRDSKGSFYPFDVDLGQFPIHFHKNLQVSKIQNFQIDFGGIAKGYIVDLVVKKIEAQDATLSGQVNAGGDLKFFNSENKLVTLRLGPQDAPLEREIQIQKKSIATSMPRDLTNLRKDLSSEHIISVSADLCYVADALTKVALYASPETIQFCSQKYSSQILVFAPNGELAEYRGLH
jgi:thiamine biosynthesis lipoprotein